MSLSVFLAQLMSPFFTSRKGQFFWLFEGARVVSDGEFAGAIIGSFLFAALATIGVESAKKVVRTTMSRRGGASIVSALVGGVMHAFRLSLHYLAMLLIMTFNVWVFLAVVVGHGVGYGLHLFVGGVLANKHRHDDASAMGSAALSKAVNSSSGSDARHKGDCC